MTKKSSRKLYTALAVAAVSTASLAPAVVTEAASKAPVVKAKSAYVYAGDLDAALDATYEGAPIHWYKSSVNLEKLGTFQTAKGIVKGKGKYIEKRVRVLDHPIAILPPSEPLVFKQGKPALGIVKQQVKFASGTYEKAVRWSKIDTSEVGEFVATATYTNRGKTITLEVPYTVEGYKLSIMHTNDTHAALDLAPKRATAIKQIRAEKPDSLLIDAGDVFSGSLYFNEFKGQADLKLMNYMKYDLMVPGNHEFDLGTEQGHKELADFVRYANFPFVSSNVNYANDQYMKSLYRDEVSQKAYNGRLYEGVIKVVDGEKVGFFGLTTEETASIASPGPIEFQNYIAEAQKAVDAFKEMGVDQIVAVSHLGYNDNPAFDNDLLLAENVDGIDIIVGGHTHTRLSAPVLITEGKTEPTVIVQADQYSNFLGTVDVEFDKDGKVIKHAGSLIDVKALQPDPYAVELLAPFKDVVDTISQDPIGVSLTAPLDNPRDKGDETAPSVRKNETALGNLITDGMLTKAKEYDSAVIGAVQNGGGIRASIDAGPVTTGEVLTTLPFGNTLAIMDLKGSELKAAFERSVGIYPIENGGFLHVSGFKVLFDSSKPAGERIVSLQYNNGTEFVDVEDATSYKVATNFFTAQGGDNYVEFETAFKDGRVNDLGLIDWENFRDHLISLGEEVTPAVEGRIVDVNAAE
ncbi:bifunctional metallophosphatase/5'-nucleotidase [Exiguobacterium profundum]|uniref:bifunctional metallophosphatase/5'-nucleotidase n=2 Tax=Bacillales Family XII. Incertae Sedis TaxID=539742 RepID=UPI0018DAA98C|nr:MULTISPECIES: 5'-nucleotidase C-terminal domain-containing protein [unclassified Exiguobacterium]MCV9900128.1 5'-nucleotidase C-terminal domain-containing protein [Exiguobacterium sp. N5]QPI68328.1 5'-nucleotidase C-terminal domain-containing protein [Exiguobacterium sp. PBE]